jgi:hypothetical protein
MTRDPMTSVRQDAVARLEHLRVPYYVTGSDAMAIHGVGFRQTNDIDFMLGIDPGGYDLVLRPAFEPTYLVATLLDTPSRWMGSAIWIAGAGKADIIIRKPDPWGAEALARRVRLDDVELGQVWVSTLEDLLLAKIEWSEGALDGLQGRDVHQLLKSAGSLDWGYLNLWAARLGVAETLARARADAA